MTPNASTRRSPAASAAALIAVLLLFGALTFVAGLAVGSDAPGAAQADPSASEAPLGSVPPDASTPAATPTLETVTCAEPTEAFAVLCETYAQIKGEYVDEISDEELVDGAVRGMIEFGLEDPYSGYLPPEQYGSALDDLSGEFSGIGAEVGMENLVEAGDLASCTVVTQSCAMVIVAPLVGSPAESAGLRAGDQVLEIDGVSTVGESVSSLVFQVRGEAGTDVTLTVNRDDEELDITITRAVIDLREVEAELLADDIGYIRLTTFTDRATGLFREELGALLEQGATSIVFDLRGNPGGFIVTAQGIAGQFVPAGELLFTVESGEDVQRWESEPGGLVQTDAIPVVVLVDEGSASASEIVAAALKESGRATIVGEPTFGKNTVQIWNDLPNGGGLRITTDRWFTPDHNSAAPDGIAPDVEVASPEDPLGGEDPQLDRAVELLTGG
ncbi:MAG: S41 family peptidase [Chloroflexi bacterium]|nr:S41 family peptidase [Chloroflexota bacterium]